MKIKALSNIFQNIANWQRSRCVELASYQMGHSLTELCDAISQPCGSVYHVDQLGFDLFKRCLSHTLPLPPSHGNVVQFFASDRALDWGSFLESVCDASLNADQDQHFAYLKDELYLVRVYEAAEKAMIEWNGLTDWHHDAMEGAELIICGVKCSIDEVIGGILSAKNPWDVRGNVENMGTDRAIFGAVRSSHQGKLRN